ncbi:MAG: hypothetical protein ACI4UT_02250 [Candidatus Enteromonas sp.]
MNIEWIDLSEEPCFITIYKTNITMNRQAKEHFEDVEFVRIGFSDDKSLVLAPVSADLLPVARLQKATLFPISVKKSYARISSTSLAKMIAEKLALDLNNEPIRLSCIFKKDLGLIAEEKGV